MDRGVFTVAGGPRRVQGRWQEFREPRGVNVRGRPSRGTKRPGKPGPFVIVRGCSWPWAQGVAGSNPVAPTTFHRNQRKHHNWNDFAARALSRSVRRGPPSQASFRSRLVPNLVTPKPRLTGAHEGACWRSAVKNGLARLRVAGDGDNKPGTRARGSCRRTTCPPEPWRRRSPTRPRRQRHSSWEWRLRGGRGGPVRRHPRVHVIEET
jgi:hypothetical protein